MNINAVYENSYNYESCKAAEREKPAKSDEKVTTKTDKAPEGVVYEKGAEPGKKATYSINKMSAEDRAALVQQMKDDFTARKNQLSDIVSKMLSMQAGKTKLSSLFTPDKLAEVSAQDIKQAKEDISEDGYFGVKQTSQRLFEFASALAGDDVEKMKDMQAAIEKGYKMAEKAWGDKLPDICKDTLDATNKLFEDYYASKSNS